MTPAQRKMLAAVLTQRASVESRAIRQIHRLIGQRVNFEVEEGPKGPQACRVVKVA